MVQSTVADSIIAGIQLAAGTRLQDTDKLTAIASRKEAILNSRQERKQREQLFPAQLQQAQSEAATSTYNLGLLPEQKRGELLERDLGNQKAAVELTDATYKLGLLPETTAQDMRKAQLDIEKAEEETTGLRIGNKKAAWELDESQTAVVAGRLLDQVINTAGEAISFNENNRVQVDGVRLLTEAPQAAVEMLNLHEQYLTSVGRDGEETRVQLVGFDRVEENGQVGFIAKVAAPGAKKSAPLTRFGTSAEEDTPVIFSPERVNAFFTNAFVGAASIGGENSNAFKVEGFKRIGEAAKEQGIIPVASGVLREAASNSALPEAAQRSLGLVIQEAIAAEDIETLTDIAKKLGISDIFANELQAQAEAFEDGYLEARMKSNNPRFQDPITAGLSNEVEANPALMYAPGAVSSSIEPALSQKKAENLAIIRQRMSAAGETFPEFVANIPKLVSLIQQRQRVLSKAEEDEVKTALDTALAPGESLTPETFVQLIQDKPEMATGVITFFAQSSDDPAEAIQQMVNFLDNGDIAYGKEQKEDDSRARDEFFVSEQTRLKELQESNEDEMLDIAGEILTHISSQDFSSSGTVNPEESAKFKNNFDKLLLRAQRAKTGKTAAILRDTVADVLLATMLQQGSLGVSGSAADFFSRRKGLQQLGGDRFERIVVSTDGKKIAFEDPSGPDVVFAGEISIGQLESRFGEQNTNAILKLIPEKQKRRF